MDYQIKTNLHFSGWLLSLALSHSMFEGQECNTARELISYLYPLMYLELMCVLGNKNRELQYRVLRDLYFRHPPSLQHLYQSVLGGSQVIYWISPHLRPVSHLFCDGIPSDVWRSKGGGGARVAVSLLVHDTARV